jgi:hypothetical protein
MPRFCRQLVSTASIVIWASRSVENSDRKCQNVVTNSRAKRLKELERENARLKKLVAEAELDKAILREAASGNF